MSLHITYGSDKVAAEMEILPKKVSIHSVRSSKGKIIDIIALNAAD